MAPVEEPPLEAARCDGRKLAPSMVEVQSRSGSPMAYDRRSTDTWQRLPLLPGSQRERHELAGRSLSASCQGVAPAEESAAHTRRRPARFGQARMVAVQQGARMEFRYQVAGPRRASLPPVHGQGQHTRDVPREARTQGRAQLAPDKEWNVDSLGRGSSLHAGRVVAVPEGPRPRMAIEGDLADRAYRLVSVLRQQAHFRDQLPADGRAQRGASVAPDQERQTQTAGCLWQQQASRVVEVLARPRVEGLRVQSRRRGLWMPRLLPGGSQIARLRKWERGTRRRNGRARTTGARRARPRSSWRAPADPRTCVSAGTAKGSEFRAVSRDAVARHPFGHPRWAAVS